MQTWHKNLYVKFPPEFNLLSRRFLATITVVPHDISIYKKLSLAEALRVIPICLRNLPYPEDVPDFWSQCSKIAPEINSIIIGANIIDELNTNYNCLPYEGIVTNLYINYDDFVGIDLILAMKLVLNLFPNTQNVILTYRNFLNETICEKEQDYISELWDEELFSNLISITIQDSIVCPSKKQKLSQFLSRFNHKYLKGVRKKIKCYTKSGSCIVDEAIQDYSIINIFIRNGWEILPIREHDFLPMLLGIYR